MTPTPCRTRPAWTTVGSTSPSPARSSPIPQGATPVARSTRITNRCGGPRARAGGFTLAESLIASVVLAAAVVGIAGTLAASYQQDTVRGNITTAINLAQQLMEEIAARPLELTSGATNKPGWSSGQTDRRQYDTIDDYNGYTDFSSSI